MELPLPRDGATADEKIQWCISMIELMDRAFNEKVRTMMQHRHAEVADLERRVAYLEAMLGPLTPARPPGRGRFDRVSHVTPHGLPPESTLEEAWVDPEEPIR